MLKKTLSILVGVLFSLLCVSFAYATDVIDVGKRISQNPENIYTVYIGMPKDEVDFNFSDVKDWEKESSQRWNSYYLKRDITPSISQHVWIQFDSTNHVSKVGNTFVLSTFTSGGTHNPEVQAVYNAMYDVLRAKYGEPHGIRMPGVRCRGGAAWFSNQHVYELTKYVWDEYTHVGLLVFPIQNSEYDKQK